jgi:hypothetical protein
MRADVIGQDHESRYQHHVGCAYDLKTAVLFVVHVSLHIVS